MILFVIYAAVVWSGAYFLRRRAMGIAIAALSPIPVMLATWLLLRWLRETQTAPTHILIVFPVAYGAVITLGAWGAALTRRHPRVSCDHCRYDLEGNLSGVCPECGTPMGSDDTPDAPDAEEGLARGAALPASAHAALAARRARARESTTDNPMTSAAPATATSATTPQ